MIKREKGITLISLIVTIVLMLIISSTTVYMSIGRFKINKIKKMFNDIELLTEKTSNYYIEYEGLPILRDNENNPIIYRYSTIDFQKNDEDNDKYYILDLQALEAISLNYGKEGFYNPNTTDDVYIINEKTHTIYYVRGFEFNGVNYHSKFNNKDNLKNDTIPPTKPEIKIVSGKKNSKGIYITEVEIEIIPGKDNWSGVNRTTYSINDGTEIDITTLTNNILKITEKGTYTIKVKTYDNNDLSSQEEINFKKIPEKAYMVKLGTNTYFKEASYKDKIKTISFVKGIDTTAVSNAIKTYELGDTTNGTETNEVIGWIDSDYNLYIGSESNIYSKNLQYAFYYMNSVTNITFNNLNTSECTSMYNMFAVCSGLTTLDVSSFDTSQVKNMQYMFAGCSGLTTLNLSSFNTSQVVTMYEMFQECSELTTLDVSGFDTSQVITMYRMFAGCSGLTTLDVGNFDTSKVTIMYGMFERCSGLTTLDLSSFNTSQVNTMRSMFEGCSGLITLDLSSFSTSQVTNMQYMFYNCKKLTTLNMSKATFENVTTYPNMFTKVPSNITIISNPTSQTFLRERLDEAIGSENGTIDVV